MTTDWDAGPVISDSIETLMKRLDVQRRDDGQLQATWQAFPQRLRWQIASMTHLVLRHKGVTVKELYSLHDTSGAYLSAITHAFEDVEGLCRSYLVDADSDLTLDIDLEVTVHPGIPLPEEEIRFDMDHTKVYRPSLADGWFRHDAGRMVKLMAPMTEQQAYEANLALDDEVIASRTVIERGLLWTSAGQASLAELPEALQAWMAAERARIEALAEAPDTSAWDLMVAVA